MSFNEIYRRHRIEMNLKEKDLILVASFMNKFLIIKWNLLKYSVTVESFVGSQVEKEQMKKKGK